MQLNPTAAATIRLQHLIEWACRKPLPSLRVRALGSVSYNALVTAFGARRILQLAQKRIRQ